MLRLVFVALVPFPIVFIACLMASPFFLACLVAGCKLEVSLFQEAIGIALQRRLEEFVR